MAQRDPVERQTARERPERTKGNDRNVSKKTDNKTDKATGKTDSVVNRADKATGKNNDKKSFTHNDETKNTINISSSNVNQNYDPEIELAEIEYDETKLRCEASRTPIDERLASYSEVSLLARQIPVVGGILEEIEGKIEDINELSEKSFNRPAFETAFMRCTKELQVQKARLDELYKDFYHRTTKTNKKVEP